MNAPRTKITFKNKSRNFKRFLNSLFFIRPNNTPTKPSQKTIVPLYGNLLVRYNNVPEIESIAPIVKPVHPTQHVLFARCKTCPEKFPQSG
ncbi:fructose-bisphosphate aldolase [Methanothermobacter sp. MT-2]|nr:fructose-bisphosphate aldolase [Methanothermobacter sp. MT-2]